MSVVFIQKHNSNLSVECVDVTAGSSMLISFWLVLNVFLRLPTGPMPFPAQVQRMNALESTRNEMVKIFLNITRVQH